MGNQPGKGGKQSNGEDQSQDDSRFELHKAAYLGNADTVLKLLQKGAPVNARDDDGRTPLYWAICYGKYKAAAALLEYRADTDQKDDEGMTVLHKAVVNSHLDCVKLLLTKNADLEARDAEMRSPLHLAAYNGDVQIAKILIEAGAKMTCRDQEGRTPLHYAGYNGHKEFAALLIDKGADVNCKDKGSRTAVAYAANNGHTEVLKTLLEGKADLDIKDGEGKTALDYANHMGQSQCIKVITEYKEKTGEGKTKDQSTRDNSNEKTQNTQPKPEVHEPNPQTKKPTVVEDEVMEFTNGDMNQSGVTNTSAISASPSKPGHLVRQQHGMLQIDKEALDNVIKQSETRDQKPPLSSSSVKQPVTIMSGAVPSHQKTTTRIREDSDDESSDSSPSPSLSASTNPPLHEDELKTSKSPTGEDVRRPRFQGNASMSSTTTAPVESQSIMDLQKRLAESQARRDEEQRAFEKEKAELESELSSIRMTYNLSKKQLETMHTKIKELEANDGPDSASSMLNSQIKQLQVEKDQLHQSFNNSQSELSRLRKQELQLREELEAEKSLRKSQATKQDTTENELSRYKTKVDDLESRLVSTQSKLQNALESGNSSSAAITQVSALQQDIQRLESVKMANEKKIKELQEKCNNRVEKCQQLEDEVEKLNQKVWELESQKRSLQSQIDDLQAEIHSKTSPEREVQPVSSQQALADQVLGLKADLQKLKQEKNEVHRNLESAEFQIRTLKQNLASQESQSQSVKQFVETLQSDVEIRSRERDEAKRKSIELETKIGRLQRELEEARLQGGSLASSTQDAYRALQNSLETATTEIDRLKRACLQIEGEKHQLQMQLHEEQLKPRQDLRAQASLEERIQKQASEFNRERNALSDQIRDLTSQITRYKSMADTLERKCEELKTRNLHSSGDLGNTARSHVELEREIESLRRTNRLLSEKLGALTVAQIGNEGNGSKEDVKAIKRAYEALQTSFQAKQEELTSALIEIESLKQTNIRMKIAQEQADAKHVQDKKKYAKKIKQLKEAISIYASTPAPYQTDPTLQMVNNQLAYSLDLSERRANDLQNSLDAEKAGREGDRKQFEIEYTRLKSLIPRSRGGLGSEFEDHSYEINELKDRLRMADERISRQSATNIENANMIDQLRMELLEYRSYIDGQPPYLLERPRSNSFRGSKSNIDAVDYAEGRSFTPRTSLRLSQGRASPVLRAADLTDISARLEALEERAGFRRDLPSPSYQGDIDLLRETISSQRSDKDEFQRAVERLRS